MNRLKQVLAANARMKNEMQEACTTTDNENGYNIILKLVDIELKQELNISLAIIADCMLENCFYNNIGGKCSPMEIVEEIERGKEVN